MLLLQDVKYIWKKSFGLIRAKSTQEKVRRIINLPFGYWVISEVDGSLSISLKFRIANMSYVHQ